ncbi:MAG TPA: hypothetical protein VHZ51_09520 [Ktedonobacteraceae bacterium]|jgi:hypothetical protein|nr:hypothetical protein [Ktedonobacteraceae bacterium]
MTKDLSRSASQYLKMVLQVRKQKIECATMVIMRDHPSRDTPKPFNAVGVRIIGRGINQMQILFQFSQHATHEQGTSRCMGLEIIGDHNGHTPSLLRTSYGGTYLLAKHVSSTSSRNAAIKPAITPVQQAKAVDFAVIPGCFNQALPASSFSRPDARESRVKGHLHLIL